MSQKYTVTERKKLLDFLFESLKGWSKKTVKQRLQGQSILVNAEIQTKHNFMLNIGDKVEIAVAQRTGYHHQMDTIKLDIILQDKDIIAINKQAGLLAVGTHKEKKKHALSLLRSQLSYKNKDLKLWPVNRLDKETSGIMLFATSKEIREAIMDKWKENKKIYLAIVEGRPKEESQTITQALRLDEKEYRMHVGAHPEAKSAITHYKVEKSSKERSQLEVHIETGRQHQIRAHMAWIGHPIVGDERYGKKGNRMGLHAKILDFVHPVTKKEIHLAVDAPRDFYALL